MKGFKPKNDLIDQNLQNDIKLYYCAYDGCEPNKSWGAGMIDHYKLFFVIKGQGYFEINNTVYTIKAGSGFVIPPNVVVSYRPTETNGWNYFWIAFNGINAENYLTRANISKNQPLFTTLYPENFLASFAKLFESENNSKATDLISLSAFYNLLSILIDECQTSTKIPSNLKPKDLYLNQAIEFIHTNYSRTIQIEDIAHHVNIDRKYLYQIFKEKINLSPKQYLIDFRIKRAKELIKTSDLSVQQISNSVGYIDPFLFSKIFKKKTGYSPTEYKKIYYL